MRHGSGGGVLSSPRTWSILLDGDTPISMNRRGHWRTHADAIRTWRTSVMWLAGAEQIPACDRIAVTLHVWPPDRRRRDRHNLHATLKPCLDGLVDAGVVADDTPDHLAGESIVLHPADGVRRWRYRIDISTAEAVDRKALP